MRNTAPDLYFSVNTYYIHLFSNKGEPVKMCTPLLNCNLLSFDLHLKYNDIYICMHNMNHCYY